MDASQDPRKAIYDWFLGTKEYWATATMIGLIAPATILLANPDVPVGAKLGTLACFVAASAKYGQENKEAVIKFGFITAISIFLIATFFFHGVITSAFQALVWMPVLISATLTSAVNVAPKVLETLEKAWEKLIHTVCVVLANRNQRVFDPEHGEGLLPTHRMASPEPYQQLPENQEDILEVVDNQSGDGSIDLDSEAARTSSPVRAALRQIDRSSGEASSLEILERSRRSESPPWAPGNRSGDLFTFARSVGTVSSSNRRETSESDIR